jgi:hypothetical protein
MFLSSAARSCGACLLAGCGGVFAGGDDDETGGQAGSGAEGGSQAGSAGRAGSSGKGGSGASAGTGSGGSAGGGCEWDGNFYAPGDTFPAGDGCNSCTCGGDGSVGCTLLFCDQCSAIETEYAAAIDEARACDPAQSDVCSHEGMWSALPCGCPTFLNPAEVEAIALAEQALDDYSAQSCGGTAFCAPCLTPTSAYCSAQGLCVDVFDTPAAASCEINATVYPSGTSAVPHPFSCNTCTCMDGQLTGCTEADCPVACPPDSVPSSQCAQCGPVDSCEVVEHACLPVCTGTTCQAGVCLDGVCKMVCG